MRYVIYDTEAIAYMYTHMGVYAFQVLEKQNHLIICFMNANWVGVFNASCDWNAKIFVNRLY